MIVTNERGGKQSKIKGMMTEVPPLALLEVSSVMGLGATNYPREDDGTPNWHQISWQSNLDHGLEHAANLMAECNKPDRSYAVMREELSHHAARAVMALEQFIREEPECTAVEADPEEHGCPFNINITCHADVCEGCRVQEVNA
jgi:hypothetical protein